MNAATETRTAIDASPDFDFAAETDMGELDAHMTETDERWALAGLDAWEGSVVAFARLADLA